MTFYDDVKRWWKSRTIWLGTVLMVIGALVEYRAANEAQWRDYFGDWGGPAAIAIGVLNVLLRLRTTKAIGKPRPQPPVISL